MKTEYWLLLGGLGIAAIIAIIMLKPTPPPVEGEAPEAQITIEVT